MLDIFPLAVYISSAEKYLFNALSSFFKLGYLAFFFIIELLSKNF